MKNLCILVGNIGTGKSTLTKELQKEGYIIIARDQLRYAIGNGNYVFDYDYEPIIWKTELYMFRKFIDLGVDIIIKEAVDRRMQDPHGQNDRKLWEQVWEKFNKQYEAPIKEEGIDRIINLRENKI